MPKIADEHLEALQKRKAEALAGGGEKRIAAQHERGKLTARERIKLLLDEGTFEELDPLVKPRNAEKGPEAVVTGWGHVDGRPIYIFSYDFTVLGGSLSEAVAEKILKVMDLALMTGSPIVGIQDSGGARIQDGPESLRGFGEMFAMNTLASGVIPQISVIMGPCAGGAVYSPAITDFIFMTEGIGQMYITGPDVIRSVTGEEITHEDLGGADAHARRSGVAHFAIDGERETLDEVRRLLSFLPSNNAEDAPLIAGLEPSETETEEISNVIPDEPNRPYDVREIVYRLVDNGDFMEVHENYAQNIVVGFARIDGSSVGFVCNQPIFIKSILVINLS